MKERLEKENNRNESKKTIDNLNSVNNNNNEYNLQHTAQRKIKSKLFKNYYDFQRF